MKSERGPDEFNGQKCGIYFTISRNVFSTLHGREIKQSTFYHTYA